MCSLRLSAEADTCGRKYCWKDFTDQVVTLCSSLIFLAGNLNQANISANPTITLSNHLTNNPFLSPFCYNRPQGRKYRRIGARYIYINSKKFSNIIQQVFNKRELWFWKRSHCWRRLHGLGAQGTRLQGQIFHPENYFIRFMISVNLNFFLHYWFEIEW